MFYILSTGTELSSGRSRDSNGPWIASRLSEAGLTVRAIVTLPDDPPILRDTIRAMIADGAHGVIMTGGLGPTEDDHTINVLSEITGRSIVEEPEALQKLEAAARRMPGRLKIESARLQVRTLEGARVLKNVKGLAPGLVTDVPSPAPTGSTLIAALPGVPSEMTPMFELLFSEIASRFAPHGRKRRAFYVYGMGESQVQSKLFGDATTRPLLGPPPEDFVWGITAHPGFAKVFFETANEAYLAHIEQETDLAFGAAKLPGPVEELLHEMCTAEKISIALAESCTGGLVSRIITDRAGSSEFFKGAGIAYSNEAKVKLLGVSESLLQAHGAVSEECARAMAEGAVRFFEADAAVSITGIAGPGGGTAEKPVGTVHCAASFRGQTASVRWMLPFDRDRIREISARAALFHLFTFLKSSRSAS